LGRDGVAWHHGSVGEIRSLRLRGRNGVSTGLVSAVSLSLFVWVALASACSPQSYCSDGCRFAADGECDDGRSGATTGLCALGTDCSDCGPNPNVQLSGELGGLGPIPGPTVGPPTGAPGPPGTSSCVCPGPALCSTSVTDPAPTGGAGFYLCGSGSPCALSAVQCPNSRFDAFSPSIEFGCRDGSFGVGCYAINAEGCEQVGTCGPPSEYGYDLGADLPSGPAIERCIRYGSFIGPDDVSGGYLFDASKCETWFQVGSSRASCGACANACDVFLTGGPNPCQGYYDDLFNDIEPPPDDVSPACRAQIDEQIRLLRMTSTSSSCLNSCLSTFASCMERSDCANITSCANSAQSCALGCL